MRSSVATLALALMVGGLVLAQSRPDISGTWNVDAEKSDPGAVPAARGGFGRGGGTPGQLIIRLMGDDLTITQNGQPVPYRFDGTETPGPPGGETKSKASWDGDKLVITWRREYYAGAKEGYVTSHGKDVYSVMGSVLTIEKTTTTPQGQTTTRKVVYNKAS